MKKYITKKVVFYALIILCATFLIFWVVTAPEGDPTSMIIEKPVIYLYPKKPTDVFVDVSVKNGRMSCTYPEKNDGWSVRALPNGSLTDKNGITYDYLFWEAQSDFSPDFSSGFVVSGKDSADFLQEKLSFMGLNQSEINEFIVYWLPKMIDNPYNLVSFQGENYDSFAPLTVSPQPDSMLRVYMALKPLNEPIQIEKQPLTPFVRQGFTVVEWGGCIIK